MVNPLDTLLAHARTHSITVIGAFAREGVIYEDGNIPFETWTSSKEGEKVVLFPLCVKFPKNDVIATEVRLGEVLLQSDLYTDVGISTLRAPYGSLKKILIKGHSSIHERDISLHCTLEDDIELIVRDITKCKSGPHRTPPVMTFKEYHVRV